MSIKSGSDSKKKLQLHCMTCGRKRFMTLLMPFPREDGKMGVAVVKLRNLVKMIRERKLPNSKSDAFPKQTLIGKCPICEQGSFFDLNESGKIVAQC